MSRVVLFGKLPAHGDFVTRGIAMAERDALDAWLSASLAQARTTAGEAFADRYDRAPPWRCTTIVEGARVAGALTPSQDGAGRRYPVLLALRDGGEEAAAACEALLYDAIAGGWSADVLVDRADTLTIADDAADAPRWWTLGGDGFAAAALPGDRPAALLSAMMQQTEPVA